MAQTTGATGTPIDWAAIYGTDNVAAQMLSDMPFSTYENMQVSGLTDQLSTIEQQVETIQQHNAAWTTLQGDAGAVNSAFSALTNTANFLGATATSSDANVITAAADATATPGTYTVTVKQLAAQEIDGTDAAGMAISSAATALNLGTTSIDLTVQGTTYRVAITPGMSLSSMATALNESGAPVAALVEQDSGNHTYYLSIFGDQVGQSISYSGSTAVWNDVGILSSTGSVNQVQAAASAEISLGSGNTYTSSTDTFANILPGITLQVASTGTSAISVTANTGHAVQTVQTFVSDWNQWVSDTQTLAFGTLPAVSSSGTFTANPHQVITSSIPMNDLNDLSQALLDTSARGYSLDTIGLTFNGAGQMVLNTGTLSSALTADPTGVQALFTALSSVATPMLSNYAIGAQSVTGEAIAIGTTQETQAESRATTIETEITNQQTAAQSSYAAWSANLEQWAETEELSNYLNKQSSSSGG